METDVGCKCGSRWEFLDGVLKCPSCGIISSYQPLPSYSELLKQLEQAKEKIKELEDKLLWIG